MGHEYTCDTIDPDGPTEGPSSQLRDDLFRRIEDHLRTLCVKDEETGERFLTYEDYRHSIECLGKANNEQLWSLYSSFVERGSKFKVLYCTDFLAIKTGTLFIGIETDGYAHS